MRKFIKTHWPVMLAILIASILKAILIFTKSVPFNGDEAVVANMARHILQGARPTFFYGQAYMGSLDAWLLAGAFKLFGETILAIRFAQSGLYLGFIVSVWWLVRLWHTDRVVHIIVVLLATIPPVMVSTYTTATLGGYGESLVLGNLILGLGWLVTAGGKQDQRGLWVLLGVIGGLGFWTLGLAGVYLLPVGILGLRYFQTKNIPNYSLAAIGFFVGSSPWWLYNFTHQWGAFWQLIIPNYAVDISLGMRLLNFIFLGIPSVLGARVPWSAMFVSTPQLIILILLYLGLGLWLIRQAWQRMLAIEAHAQFLLGVLFLTLLGLLLGSGFGADVTGRYLLPFYLLVLLGLGGFTARAWHMNNAAGVSLLVVIVGLNALATAQAMQAPEKLTTQYDPITEFGNQYDEALIAFLEENEEYRGYTNYWVTYRLAFLSDERLLYSAELPDKANLSYTPLYLRYAPYVEAANTSDKVAIITTKHPDLDRVLETYFAEAGIQYQEEMIGPYHIYYQLSAEFRPEDIGYGEAYTAETQTRWSEFINE